MTTKIPQFNITKEKWSWAEEVQSKNIYRDEEFIKTTGEKESLLAIDYLMGRPSGLTYTITTKRNGEYFTYFRHNMPCLGGLVKYKASHGEKYNMNPYFPRDIYVAFPEGEIIYIACHRTQINKFLETPYGKFVFSKESPWVAAFNDIKSIIFKDNYFVLTDMNTDPTVFYSLMRLGGVFGGYCGNTSNNLHPKIDILINKTSQADPRRLAGQKPIKTSGGTWSEGFGYTRPYNESIFKTALPHKLNEFHKLAGYPQAPFTNEYFVSTMKNKFNIDALHLNAKFVGENKELQEVLLKSWDYFKEESKKLDE